MKRKNGFTRWRGGRGEQARQTAALSAPPREPVWPRRTGYSVDPAGTGRRRSFSSELQAASPARKVQTGKTTKHTKYTKAPGNEIRLNSVAHGTHGTGGNRIATPALPYLRAPASGGPLKRKKGFTRWRGGRGDQARQTSALSAPPREPVSPKRTAYSAAPTCSGARRDPIDGSEPSRSPTEHTEDTEPDGIGPPFL